MAPVRPRTPFSRPAAFASLLRHHHQAGTTLMQQLARSTAEKPYRHLEIRRIAGSLGAEIHGVDLAALSDEAFAEIYRAFVDHQVIFFRDQAFDPDSYLAFARRWGKIAIYPYMKGLESHPEILQIVKSEQDTYAFGNAWHTDTSFAPIPPKATMLHALEVPPAGGDTLFANLYAAYETLSDGMRAMLAPLRTHCVGDRPTRRFTEVRAMARRDPGGEPVEAIHPVVRTHPDSGREALYIGHHSIRFDGMSEEESAPLLGFLLTHATRPEFTCRFSWVPGSVAIWDNRCTLHYAIDDYSGHRRRMNRIIIEGEEAPY
jgi:taurine dioxygenase